MIEWEKGRSSRFAALERLGTCGWCARAQRRGDVIAQLDTELTAEHSLVTHRGDAFPAGDALLTIQVLDLRAIATLPTHCNPFYRAPQRVQPPRVAYSIPQTRARDESTHFPPTTDGWAIQLWLHGRVFPQE
jgi:hypothetical protein